MTTSAPSESPLEQVRHLETQFAAAMTQLYAVGNGLARVRADLMQPGTAAQSPTPSVIPAPTPTPDPSPVPMEGRRPVEDPAGARPLAPAVAPTTAPGPSSAPAPSSAVPATAPASTMPPDLSPAEPRESWWERPGAVAKVLGVVGAVVTLIGVAFLLAIAIAAGLFGPVPRTIAGALLAAALLSGGAVARRRSPDSTGGEALAATGLAAAYLDLLAASALYHFVPGWLGLVLAGALAVGAFLLARAWDSQLLAVLAAAPPMFLAPAVTGIDSLAAMSFVAVLLVGSAIAHLGRAWPWLYAARTIPAVLVLLVATGAQGVGFPTITVTAAVALGMVAAGVVEQSRALTHHPTWAAAGASLPLVAAVGALDGGRLAVAAALSGLFLAVAGLVAGLTGRIVAARSLWVAPMVTGTVLLILAAGALRSDGWSGLVLAVASAAYGLVAVWRASRPVAWTGATLAALSTMAFLPTIVSTISVATSRSQAEPPILVHGLVLTVVAVATMVFSAALTGGTRNPLVTRAAGVWAFVTGSATVITTGTWLGLLADNARVGFYGGHAVATALWTALAAVLMTVVARRGRDRALLMRTGLVLVFAAVAKLFLFDLSALSGLFRVVAFVVSGIIVLMLGVVVSREQSRPDSESAEPRTSATV